ncbi:MAG: hypothetical protein JNJ57_06940 [Saprospiraceae bacterium]|nr:hypothetical protein [Saprospiraceae bacterium]
MAGINNFFSFDLVMSLSEDEANGFRRYLKGEEEKNHLKADQIERLFDVLFSLKLELKDDIEKDDLYPKVFPGKPFVHNKLEKLSSELNNSLRQYLLMERYLKEENDVQRQLDWLAELRDRSLSSRHHQLSGKLAKQLEPEQNESIDRYWFRFLLEKEQHEWLALFSPKSELNLPNLLNAFDAFYFAFRTESLNRLLLISRFALLSPEGAQYIEQEWQNQHNGHQSRLYLSLLAKIHLLLKDNAPSVEGFQRLLEKIKQDEQYIDANSLKGVYSYVRSLSTFLIDSGRNEFAPLLHEIHKQNLEDGHFYSQGNIPPSSLLNIIKIGLKVGEVQWCREIVENHKNRIIGDSPEKDYYSLMLALCFFSEQKYEQALSILPFDSNSPTYYLMARRLELKIYYEVRSDLMPFKLDAFRMYVRRTGIKTFPAEMYEQFVNFANLLRQLYLSSGIVDPSRSMQLVKRIQSKKRIAERSWLLEKAQELGQKKAKI